MKVYVTLEYRLPYGPVNSLWAAARQHGFVPDRIVLLTPDPASEIARQHVSMLAAVQAAFDKPANVETVTIQPDDLAATRAVVRKFVHARKMEGHEVALDVTSGRTIPKLALFQAAVEERPQHIFYLSVGAYDYRPLPYLKIPRRMQECRDLLSEVVDA